MKKLLTYIPRYRYLVLGCGLFHLVLLALAVVLAATGQIDWSAPILLTAALGLYVYIYASLRSTLRAIRLRSNETRRSLRQLTRLAQGLDKNNRSLQRELASLRSFIDATSGPTLREWDQGNQELAAAIASLEDSIRDAE